VQQELLLGVVREEHVVEVPGNRVDLQQARVRGDLTEHPDDAEAHAVGAVLALDVDAAVGRHASPKGRACVDAAAARVVLRPPVRGPLAVHTRRSLALARQRWAEQWPYEVIKRVFTRRGELAYPQGAVLSPVAHVLEVRQADDGGRQRVL
jgi:hypothetical protein